MNNYKQQFNSPVIIISARMKLIFNYLIFPFTNISKLVKIKLRSIHLLQYQANLSQGESTHYHHSNKILKIKFKSKFLLCHNININLISKFQSKISSLFINNTSHQQKNLPTMVNNVFKNFFLIFNFFNSSQS